MLGCWLLLNTNVLPRPPLPPLALPLALPLTFTNNNLTYMWQSQIEIEYYSVVYFSIAISSASPSLTHYRAELPLGVGLITCYVNA